MVNERLATRSGAIGRLFKHLEMGRREYSQHTLLRAFKVVNYFWMQIFHVLGTFRPIGSRFLTSLGNGPLNYSALFCYGWCTMCVFARCRFENSRDLYAFKALSLAMASILPSFWPGFRSTLPREDVCWFGVCSLMRMLVKNYLKLL